MKRQSAVGSSALGSPIVGIRNERRVALMISVINSNEKLDSLPRSPEARPSTRATAAEVAFTMSGAACSRAVQCNIPKGM